MIDRGLAHDAKTVRARELLHALSIARVPRHEHECGTRILRRESLERDYQRFVLAFVNAATDDDDVVFGIAEPRP